MTAAKINVQARRKISVGRGEGDRRASSPTGTFRRISTRTVRPKYSLIVGQGRSGTNWLLTLFNQSAETFCRNEPNIVAESPLNRIADDSKLPWPSRETLESQWDQAMAWTSVRLGEPDYNHAFPVRKNYLRSASWQLGLHRLMEGERRRLILRGIVPTLQGREWRIPSWIADPVKLAQAPAIFKIVGQAGWVDFALRHRPDIPVFHIVRHPGGFLNSWANRVAANLDPAAHRRTNRARLRSIVDVRPEWASRFGNIESMSAERAELWNYMYVNEVIFAAGQASENYHRILYEDLVANTVEVMKYCYSAVELEWNREVEALISAHRSNSASIASAWKKKLSAECIELVEEFLALNPEFHSTELGNTPVPLAR